MRISCTVDPLLCWDFRTVCLNKNPEFVSEEPKNHSRKTCFLNIIKFDTQCIQYLENLLFFELIINTVVVQNVC